MWKGHQQPSLKSPMLSPMTPSPLESSFLLTYALHFEVKLMRKIWDNLKEHSIIRQTERTNSKLARKHYAIKIKSKIFVAIHKYYLAHFGHKFAKIQASTAEKYFISRRALNSWRLVFITQITHKMKVERF